MFTELFTIETRIAEYGLVDLGSTHISKCQGPQTNLTSFLYFYRFLVLLVLGSQSWRKEKSLRRSKNTEQFDFYVRSEKGRKVG